MRELHEVETMEVTGGISFGESLSAIQSGINGLASWALREDNAPSFSDSLLTLGAGIGGILGSLAESISKWFKK